jgi:AraC-like DNA-binding protein
MNSVYRELLPPDRLRPWVQCFWSQETSPAAGSVHRVLPDGCIDILFETAAGGARELYVVGMMTRPLLVARTEAASFTGVRFKPGAAAAFFREPLHRLTDARIDLQELWPRTGPLHERLSSALAARDRAGLLAAELEQRLGEASIRGHAGCSFAVRQLTSEPDTGVGDLCTRLGVSRQALARSFREHVGVSPKTLSRVLRLQRALRLLARPPGDGPPRWVDVALDAGYYDQSHLIADFRDLVGLTPSAYLLESGRGSPALAASAVGAASPARPVAAAILSPLSAGGPPRSPSRA